MRNYVQIPFLLIGLQNDSKYNILMGEDNTELFIQINRPCQLYNENHVLWELNLLKDIENVEIKDIYKEV